MQENKLFRYLKKLGNSEIKRFVLFLRSPYHSTNKPALKLVEYLIKYHPEFESPRLKKETIFKKIYGTSRAFHEGRLEQVMTQTVKLFEQFLAVDTMLADPMKVSKHKMAAYKRKKLDKAFFRETEKQKEKIEAMPEGPLKYLEGYEVSRELFFHPATERTKVEMPCLDDYIENLDWFILWEKQLTTNYALNRELVFPKKYEIKFYDAIKEECEPYFKKNMYLKFLRRISVRQSNLTDDELKSLASEFEKVASEFDSLLRKNIFSFLINNLTIRYRVDGDKFLPSLFSLMKFRFKNDYLSTDGKIEATKFTSLVTLACKSGEFDWIQNVIDENVERIEDDDKLDTVGLAYGYLFYHKGERSGEKENYTKALDALLKVNQNRPFFTYQVKSLLLRCYFEIYFDKVEYQYFLNDFSLAFERHLNRDKTLSISKKDSYSNFCKIVRRLVKLRFEKNESMNKFKDLKNRVENEEILFGKEWLMEKIEELEMQLLS